MADINDRTQLATQQEAHVSDNQMTTEQVKQWRQALENEDAIRKEAGLRIDPENCEVKCVWDGSFMDPYGVLSGLTCDQQADILDFDGSYENWFARAADGDTWVLFDHLPEATQAPLENKWCPKTDPEALRCCDHCGHPAMGDPLSPYDWEGRPDGIWLHRWCEAPWFDSAGAPLVCDSPDEATP